MCFPAGVAAELLERTPHWVQVRTPSASKASEGAAGGGSSTRPLELLKQLRADPIFSR